MNEPTELLESCYKKLDSLFNDWKSEKDCALFLLWTYSPEGLALKPH